MNPPIIVWFRRNLRLVDNIPLCAAAESGGAIVAVYVHDPAQPCGGASKWWLHHSLSSLDRSLQRSGGRLVIRRGDAACEINGLVESTGARHIYFPRQYDPLARNDERRLEERVANDAELHAYDDALLAAPDTVTTRSGTPYKVFTPYWKAAVEAGDPPAPRSAPRNVSFFPVDDGLRVGDLELLPAGVDWSQGLRNTWQPGENGALDQLDAALDNVHRYATERDRPDLDTTSRLSPFLHFGEVGPRQLWHALRTAEAGAARSQGSEALLRQLYWREFSTYLLYHFPLLPESPLRPEFEHFPWTNDECAFAAWRNGTTGYPLVDAGMRQLWHTGWMHNRVRMVVASFLVKNLMIDWQTGADWFLDTLVDADLANNSAGWQWVAGCGTDAAPYFRIFNPLLQSAKFDPKGTYIRRWVPELSKLPNAHIHEPWKADDTIQRMAQVRIGEDYPRPIVDLAASRERALEAYQLVRGLLQSRTDRPGSSVG